MQVEPEHWTEWLKGAVDDAVELLKPASLELFDLVDVERTNAALTAQRLGA